MYQPRNIVAKPRSAWTDYNPPGPWADGAQVTNADGVGFTYNATLNTLTVIPNQSWAQKDANSLAIVNVPDPVNNLDAANKEYVDTHGGTGGGGGIPEAPSDGTLYGRENAGWVHAVPLAGGTMTGLLTLSGAPTVSLNAATKGYVDGAVPTPSTTTPAMDGTGAVGTSTLYTRGDHVHPTDTSRAPLASPAFTGNPTAPTPLTADNSTAIATTAFVKAQGYQVTNATITLSGDISGSGATAIATTLATVNTNVGTYQGITVNGKGLVTSAVNMNYALASSVPGPATTAPLMNGTAAVGVSVLYARQDHVHPTDTSRAPLASPAFTGTPTAPTPLTADSSTNIATTAYVKGQGYLTGNQTITLSGDVSGSGAAAITTALATVNSNVGTFQGLTVNGKGLVTAAANQNYAPLASPTFTGTPVAPTATAGTSTTQLATTAFVGTALTNAAVPGPATVAPLMNGTAAVGTSLLYARQDHVHPSDTSKLSDAPSDGNTYGRKNGAWSTVAAGGAYIQDTAPTGTIVAGSLWWNSSNGQLYVYYNDGTSSQWVFAASAASGLQVVRSYLAGLTLSTAGSSATFSVAAGQAADSTNIDMLTLNAAISKTTAAWAAGAGVGALDTGAIAASSWYYVHLIKNPSTLAVDVLISLSPTAPTLPSGYTEFRRIGAMLTNSSLQWTNFNQYGDEFWFNPPSQDLNNVNPGTTATPYPILIPPAIPVTVNVSIVFNSTGSAASSLQISTNLMASAGVLALYGQSSGAYNSMTAQLKISNGQIIFTAGQTANHVYLSTLSWTDPRGRYN